MDDLVQNASNVTSNTSATPAENLNVSSNAQAQEKMFKQSEVNEHIARAKAEAYERAKRESVAEKQNQSIPQDYAQQRPQTLGGMEQMTPEKFRELVEQTTDEKILKLVNNANSQRMATEFVQKLETAKDRYSDFESVVEKLQLQNLVPIVHLANEVNNTADVIYDLGKNPHKIATIMALAKEAPHLARLEMQKLSDSIKRNEEAANQRQPQEPINHVKHSNFGTDSGSRSVDDWRMNPLLKA